MIPITKAVFDENDFALIQEPLRSGWVVQGKYVAQFEKAFADLTRAGHAAAVSSCTTGLHIAMAALGLKPDDEVIVPAFTWIATPNCVEYLGAKPVFVDIDLKTFNLDVGQLEQRITPRTRGIIPVHLFGLSADMAPIMELARRHGLWIVEDAACAFGASYRGRHVGSFAEFGCFSFHPRKSITTGEGGMITTQEPSLDKLVRTLRDHGASRSDLERHQQKYSFLLAEYRHLGFNFRMTDIQGALGVTQMQKAPSIMTARRSAAARYDTLLAGLPWLQLPYRHPKYVHGYQSYVCLWKPDTQLGIGSHKWFEQRNDAMAKLEADGIMTRPGTHAPPHLDYYARKYDIKPADYPNAYVAERMTVTLPLYATMTATESTQVSEAVRKLFAPD